MDAVLFSENKTIITKFEDVSKLTTEDYFNNNQFSVDAFRKKYCLFEGETYVEAIKRVCDYIASVEATEEERKYWSQRWFDEIYNDWWHPAGSIMQGAGSKKKISLSNCTTISLGKISDDEEWDNLESIIKNTAYTVAKTAAYRQGLGVDFSRIRPRGTAVLNSAKESTGAVHWMKYIDSIGYYVGQCLSANSPVLTPFGYRKISEIVNEAKETEVYTSSGLSIVKGWNKSNPKLLSKIVTEYGDIIECSNDHELVITDGYELKKVASSEIKENDFIVCRRNKLVIENRIQFEPFEYKIDEYNNSNRLITPFIIPTELSEELAYIIGIIYGDGCFTNGVIEIALGEDWPEIIERLSHCIEVVFGLKIGDSGCHLRKGDGKVQRLGLGRWFYDFFQHIGCKKGKANNLGFPDIFRNCSQTVLESFFAGVFDADGHNPTKKRNCKLTMIDNEFLYNLKLEMQKFGYVLRLAVNTKRRKTGFEEKWFDVYSISGVGIRTMELMANTPSVKLNGSKTLSGKYDRLKTPYLAKKLGLDYNKLGDINNYQFVPDIKYEKYLGNASDLFVQKISSITSLGLEECYDIAVEAECHDYVVGNVVVGNCGRVPAMLFSLNINHPDVEEFIQVKKDYTQIQNANISVQCTDKFYEAVEQDKNWLLEFKIPAIKKGQKVYIDVHSVSMESLKDEKGYYYIASHPRPAEHLTKTVSARKLLELIAKNMYQNAEPGIQNIDIAKKYSNSDYVYDPSDEYDSRIISSNACSEQYLSRESLCVLASLNAGKFSEEETESILELEKVSYSINRFLDNVNECELKYSTYATPHQRLAIEKLRRTGAGSTNWASFLFKRNLSYGSESGNLAVAKFNELYNYFLYRSSQDLGKEKGSFGLFKKEKFIRSPFVKSMLKRFKDLHFDTMRNVTCSSIAPTGTLSTQFRDMVLSYGIEPPFGMYYWKRTRISGKYEYYFCVPKIVRDVFEAKGHTIPMASDTLKDTWDGLLGQPIVEHIEKYAKQLGIDFVDATKIQVLDKLDLMSQVMKDCDSSISVTYMLPENTNWKEIYDFIIQAHKKEVKSIAAFPDKKMYGIVSFVPFEALAKKLISEGVEIHKQNFSDDEYAKLNFAEEINVDEKIQKTNAPKRPASLPCKVHKFTSRGEKFYCLVGLMNSEPYEVFIGKENDVEPLKGETGNITKIKRGQYVFNPGNVVISDLENHEDVDALARLISTSLRHGADISYIVQQLEKTEGVLVSFAKVLARCLKKYIPDGTAVTGERMAGCDRTDCQLIRTEGCVSCVTCGNSKCN